MLISCTLSSTKWSVYDAANLDFRHKGSVCSQTIGGHSCCTAWKTQHTKCSLAIMCVDMAKGGQG
eukprot:4015737-Amphidinium_carterae.1